MTINVSFKTHSHTAKVVFEDFVDNEWKQASEQVVQPENEFTQCVYRGRRMIVEEIEPE